jgi:hypothetical protein
MFRLPAAPSGGDQYVLASIGTNSLPVRLYIDGGDPTLVQMNGEVVATVLDTSVYTALNVEVGGGIVTVNGISNTEGASSRFYLGNAFPEELLDTGQLSYFDLATLTVSEVAPSTLEVGAGYPEFSGARLSKTAVQAIPTATATAVTFEAAFQDTDGYWAVGQPSRLTAPADGVYLVGATVELSLIDADKYVILRIYRNGTHVDTTDSGRARIQTGGTTTPNYALVLTRLVPMTAGQYVEAFIEHNHGSNRNARESVNGTGFWIARIA